MSPRLQIALGVFVVAGLVGGYWFGLMAPARSELSSIQPQITQAESQRVTALAAFAQGERDRARYGRYYRSLARLAKAVPADDEVAALVAQLDRVATANQIDFRAVSLSAAPEPPPMKPVDVDAAASKDGGDAGGDNADTSKSDSASADSAAGPLAPSVAQAPAGAAVGTAGLETLPFSFTFDGGYLAMQRFLQAIDDLADSSNGLIRVRGRLLTVDGFSLAAGRKGFPSVNATVSATAYLSPDPAGLLGGSTPQAPALGTGAKGAQDG